VVPQYPAAAVVAFTQRRRLLKPLNLGGSASKQRSSSSAKAKAGQRGLEPEPEPEPGQSPRPFQPGFLSKRRDEKKKRKPVTGSPPAPAPGPDAASADTPTAASAAATADPAARNRTLSERFMTAEVLPKLSAALDAEFRVRALHAEVRRAAPLAAYLFGPTRCLRGDFHTTMSCSRSWQLAELASVPTMPG
jgi:hypothetical protein